MADRMTEADWERVGRHAAPQAIEARLKDAKRARDAAQRTVDRWEALLAVRAAQVEAGEWPPKVERIPWGDLKPGDVLHDPDRETPVEDVKTEHGWTYIHYRLNGSFYWRSAPADREVTIRPRIEQED